KKPQAGQGTLPGSSAMNLMMGSEKGMRTRSMMKCYHAHQGAAGSTQGWHSIRLFLPLRDLEVQGVDTILQPLLGLREGFDLMKQGDHFVDDLHESLVVRKTDGDGW